MHHPEVKHTIDIFERMSNNLPPLLPAEIKEEVEHALEHLHDDFTVSAQDVEEVVIALGKKVWPYWKAFDELFSMAQGKLGEKFLLGKLSPEFKQRYKEFKEHGADYHDLRLGGPMGFFQSEERQVLMASLVKVDGEIRQHVEQEVLSVDRRKYEDLVVDFQEVLDDIEKRLESLRLLAEDEEEHPSLADEVRAQVQAFEFGLCLLGPHTQHHEVHNAEDYFVERKKDKQVHRFQ